MKQKASRPVSEIGDVTRDCDAKDKLPNVDISIYVKLKCLYFPVMHEIVFSYSKIIRVSSDT